MYLDVDVFYAVIKENDRHKKFALTALKEKNKYTSIVSLLELEILVKREINDLFSQEIFEFFKQKFPDVKIIDFNEKIMEKSQELRKNFSLGIFDSIHAATCLINNKKMASTDNAYKRIPEIKLLRNS